MTNQVKRVVTPSGNVRKTALLGLMIMLFFTITEYFYIINCTDVYGSMRTISIIILINIFIKLTIIKKSGFPLCSFFSAFIVFYYLIHFGQVLMQGVFPLYHYDYMNYIMIYMKDIELLRKTIAVCVNCINCFFIGGLLTFLSIDQQLYNNTTIKTEESSSAIRAVFYTLLPFRLLFDITYLTAAFSGGYRATMGGSLPGVFSAFATMWYVVMPLYYLDIKDLKKKRLFAILVSIYVVLTMLTGRRGHVVIALASLAIAVLGGKESIPLKKIVKYSVGCFCGLIFLDLIYEMRSTSISAFLENREDVIKNVVSHNIVLETIGTFGESIFTPYLVVKGYGSIYTPFWGECFIKSLASIVPDVFGWFKQINNEAIFSRCLGTNNAIGGSFAGEMYYNFGEWYPLTSIILGFIISKASNKVFVGIKNGDCSKIISSFSFCSLSLWWIRDNIGNMLRQYVWIVLLYYLFSSLFGRKSSGKENVTYGSGDINLVSKQ